MSVKKKAGLIVKYVEMVCIPVFFSSFFDFFFFFLQSNLMRGC